MAFADVNGQRLAYDDTGGEGSPIVLAHGFLMDRTMFAAQVHALAGEFRVVTWDERGFGDTEWDGQPFTYWDSARDCLGLMDHLGIHRAVVGGMSQGGFLSLRTALIAPERVRALVLLNSGAHAETPEMLEGFVGLLGILHEQGWVDEVADGVADRIIHDPEINRIWIEKWRSRGMAAMDAVSDCLNGREDLQDRLFEITCPALVVHGSEDQGIAPALAERMANGLTNVTGPVWIAGAAHAANMTHPAEVNLAILEFLRSLNP